LNSLLPSISPRFSSSNDLLSRQQKHLACDDFMIRQHFMILVIDNYDSFTFNLVHYLMELGAEVRVERNDALSAGEALASGADAFLISPGPCTPDQAGISIDL